MTALDELIDELTLVARNCSKWTIVRARLCRTHMQNFSPVSAYLKRETLS